eukprot:5903386-Alexandrium_andersonii.AAC.1
MCIRDSRPLTGCVRTTGWIAKGGAASCSNSVRTCVCPTEAVRCRFGRRQRGCLLYTSDAADDM